jgi:hypothetical protein
MAVYSVTNKYLIDDFAVLQLLTPTEIAVGESITVAGVDATFNGSNLVVRALPQYRYVGVDTQGDLLYDIDEPIANQVLYAKVADDVDRVASHRHSHLHADLHLGICRRTNYLPWRTDHKPIRRLHAHYTGCIGWQPVLLPSPPRSWLHRQPDNQPRWRPDVRHAHVLCSSMAQPWLA